MATPRLKALMLDARTRVLHLYLILLAIIVAISLQIPGPRPTTSWIGAVATWAFGCLVLLGLGAWWLRARFRASERLLALVESGACRIQKTEVTTLSLYIIPFGVEVDLHLPSGERLAVGFWREASVEALLAELAPFVAGQ